MGYIRSLRLAWTMVATSVLKHETFYILDGNESIPSSLHSPVFGFYIISCSDGSCMPRLTLDKCVTKETRPVLYSLLPQQESWSWIWAKQKGAFIPHWCSVKFSQSFRLGWSKCEFLGIKGHGLWWIELSGHHKEEMFIGIESILAICIFVPSNRSFCCETGS